VGIGTLIVFIAMVLVAAIAAGVLINTAGFLQSQAEATGQESTDLVSERIDVTSTVGIVDEANTDNLSSIRVGVAGAAGSNQIDLSSSTIQAVGPNGQQNLIFTDTNAVGDTGDSITNQDNTTVDIPEGTFAVENTSSGNFVPASEAVLNDEERFTIVLNPTTEPFGSDSETFGQSDQSSLDIVSPSGATTSVDLRAPDLFTEGGEAVRL
jgi:flagellin FlaB